jgi:hypothetical protein
MNKFSLEDFSNELKHRNVAVWRSSDASWSAIPVALTPTIVSTDAWSSMLEDAQLVLSAFPKVMSWLLSLVGTDEAKRFFLDKMLTGLSAYESKVARLSPWDSWGHVTVRLDLFWHHGALKIIEVNCTIPAMQAYSDNVLAAWQIARGESDRVTGNVDDLLLSLLGRYRMNGGICSRPRLAILHRDGDSQMGELHWIKKRWSESGFETELVTPDSLTSYEDMWLANKKPCDIVYRHIFASRIQNDWLLERLENPSQYHIYNPISAHYECKAFLAILSYVAADPAMGTSAGLTKEESNAIERRLPWSRVIGGPLASVSGEVIERRLEGLVLKRSVGCGGHHVILGDSWYSNDTQRKLNDMTGISGSVDLRSFLTWIELDQSHWVVQERMSGARRQTEVLVRSGVESWNAWFDVSMFLNTNGRPICGGGVSRIALNPIVNIGTGGGLAPLLIQP